MKFWNFIVFISIVLFVYGSVNFYIYIRGLHAISSLPTLRPYYIAFFLFLALSFWAGRILENYLLSFFTDLLVWVGVFWLAFMLYAFLFILLLDFLRLINNLIPYFPSFITENYEKVKLISAGALLTVVLSVIVLGYVNFLNPRIYKINISIPKKSCSLDSLNIAVASDIHLGTVVGNSRMKQIIKKIKDLDPDMMLLPGDIIDEDLAPVIKQNLGACLNELNAPFGVYGITGNHEYIGGVEKAVEYLESHGVKMIRDSYVFIEAGIYIVGREDRSITQFTGKKRKPLNEILKGVKQDFPAILLDHQPFELRAASENGIDLQLSGHTHHGQMWPLNYLTNMIYELSWGYKKLGSTHYYVSSGAAGWGPPVRTGSRTEIVNVRISFE